MKLKLKIFVIALVVFTFYYWTATAGRLTFNLNFDHFSYYNLLTSGFLKGQLGLDYKPRPELLALADPWDPAANGPYRLHDGSLYKGKYYLYFGPTAVITLFMPYHLFTKKYMPENFEMFVFAFGGFLWTLLLVVYIRKIFFPEVPNWILLTSICVLGFANVLPYCLRRPAIWEAAVVCGFFYLTGAIYWLCTAFRSPVPSFWRLLLGSTFLGLSIGGRPQFVLLAVLILIIWRKIKDLRLDPKVEAKNLFAAFAPFLIFVTSLGIYNYLRFDNPFEFGVKWVTGQQNTPHLEYLHLRNIAFNTYFYLFQLPTINSSFPFVHLNPSFPSFLPSPIPGKYILETIGGLVPSVPFLFLFFAAPFIYLRYKERGILPPFLSKINFPSPFYEFCIITIPAILNFMILLVNGAVSMRYCVDVVPYLLLSSCMIWFYFDSILTNSNIKTKVRKFISVLAILSILFGMSYSIKGQYDGLRSDNPELYSIVENNFKPVSDILKVIVPLWGQK